ncbi:MAG: hypothetical protein HY904_07530 [Deltaproteobacteria bacterium]|nr:hypothetical protein [Deltaproteobacteria bacterium]
MLALLEKAGLPVDEQDIIPGGATDEQVIRAVRGRTTDVLVVPFHAHTDEAGNAVNGLDLAERLIEAVPRLAGVPIIMPASLAVLAGARLRIASAGTRSSSAYVRAATLLVDESELERPETLAAVVAHVRPSRGSKRPGIRE